jgi:hypothetical protein
MQTCRDLLAQEKEFDIQLNLAEALLGQFAEEGIEAARQLLLGRELDFQSRGLRSFLLETCTIMGKSFPEYDEWLATEKADKEEHFRRVKELQGDPTGLLLFALEKLTGKKVADVAQAKSEKKPPTMPKPIPRLPPSRKSEGKQKVGRNDPCPCGSGKKFKHCCMRK